MQTHQLEQTPRILDMIDLAAQDPQRATQLGVSLIVVGVALLVLVAIFSS